VRLAGRRLDPSPDASDLDARTEGAAADASPAPRIVVTPITTSHRAIPGQMFGGWGPHLGHLVRASGGELFFVDDACEAQGPTACDVNRNTRLDAWAFDEATRTWKKRSRTRGPSRAGARSSRTA
jgi:hypothetical protein